MAYADSSNDLRLMIKLGADLSGEKLTKASQGLSLEVSDEPGGINFSLQ